MNCHSFQIRVKYVVVDLTAWKPQRRYKRIASLVVAVNKLSSSVLIQGMG